MTGLTGAALGNLNRIGVRALGGLGINLGALEEDLKEAEAAAISAAEKIRNASKGAPNEQKARFEALKQALPGIGKALGTALIDPLTIGLVSTKNLFEAFKELDKAQTGFKQLTGDTADTFQQLTSNAATAVEVIEVASSLTRQLGTNAEAIFGPETLLQITEAKNLLGLTAEQASDLAVLSRVSGVNAESFQQQLDTGADNANRLAGSAISSKIALEDVLSVSDGIQLSLGGSGEKLGEAAVAARALGLELSEVDAIASSLLDFESSIENELQAQLLTGRQLNLTRARELALNNDLAGVANEVTTNLISSTEFANMNRIAQEGFASAIGVSRDQLARMIIQQDMNNSLTEEARAEMLGLTMEQYASQEAAEALRRSFQGIAQSVVGIVQPFANFLTDNQSLLETTVKLAAAYKAIQLTQSLGLAIAKSRLLVSRKESLIAIRNNLQRVIENRLATKILAKDTASAVARTISSGGLALLAGGAAAAAVAGIIYGASKISQQDDAIINPRGGLIVSGPEGSFQLNPNDSIIAGTNLAPAPLTPPPGLSLEAPDMQPQTMTTISMKEVESKLDQLISIVKEGGDVYMDGNKVGTAVVLSSYKSS